MEYEFIYDTKAKIHSIEIVGEQQAMGKFLNHEFQISGRQNTSLLELIEQVADMVEGRLQFKEWFLDIDEDEIMLINNALILPGDIEVEENFTHADWELRCGCGKDDFINLLSSWADFIENH